MKKFSLLLIIILVFSLTACSPNMTKENTENLNTGVLGPLNEEKLAVVDDYIKAMDSDSLLSEKDIKTLAASDIEASISQISKANNDSFSFVLTFKNKEGKEIVKNITAYLSYSDFEGYGIENISHYWGSLSFLDGKLIITTKDNIEVYTYKKFNKIDLSPDLSSYTNSYLLTTIPDGNEYNCIYFNENETGYFTLNSKGEIINSQIFQSEDSYPGQAAYYNKQQTAPTNANVYLPTILMPKKLYRMEESYIIEEMAWDRALEYSFASNVMTNLHTVENCFVNDENILLIKCENPSEYVINTYKKGELERSFIFETEVLNGNFLWREEGYPLQVKSENGIITFCDPKSFCTLTVDFETAKVEYNFESESLEFDENTIYSKDKRYSLHSGYRTAGGDSWRSYMTVLDSKTGKNTFIDVTGGMYGGNSDIGFFSNNDIYSIDNEKFKVFSQADNFKEVLDLHDTLNLGLYDNNEMYRAIFAVRRESKTNKFIVVYSQIPLKEIQNNENLFLSSKYIIGFLNDKGELIESYETSQKVAHNAFGFNSVSMYLEGDILHISANFKEKEIFTGLFNVKMKEYKDTTKT